MNQERAGIQAVQLSRTEQGAGRVQTRLPGAEFAKDVHIANRLRDTKRQEAAVGAL